VIADLFYDNTDFMDTLVSEAILDINTIIPLGLDFVQNKTALVEGVLLVLQ